MTTRKSALDEVIESAEATPPEEMTGLMGQLLASARSINARNKGEPTGSRLTFFPRGAAPDVAGIRASLGLSQSQFSERFGIPVATLRKWEIGKRAPDAATVVLLRCIVADPEFVARAARGEAA